MTTRLCFLLSLFLLLPAFAFAQPTWIGETLPMDYPQATGVNAVDLELDGTVELLVASLSEGIDLWRFVDDSWQREVVYSGAGAQHASAVNLDDDPELEVLGSFSSNDRLILCDRNADDMWVVTVLFTNVDYLYYHSVGDLDQDGDTDILGAGNGNDEVLWWENEGDMTWTEHVVGTVAGVVRVEMADFNSDGEPDLVASGYDDGTVVLFTNLGGAQDWSAETLISGFDAAFGLLPADVDSDGDMDLFASAGIAGEIRLLSNTPGGFVSETIVSDWSGARDMVWVDIDGEGVKDIVCCGYWSGVAWFRGEDNWLPQEVELISVQGFSEVTVADLDGDNDLDIASAAWFGGYARTWLREGAGGPVQLNLTLQNAPVILPPGGGEILFDVHITSELSFPVPGLTGMTIVELPNGQMFGPLLQQSLTLPAYADLLIFNIAQVVPALAPSGTYHYYAYLGLNEDLFLSDSFQFSKQAVMPAGGGETVRLNRPANPPVEGAVLDGAAVPVVPVPERANRAPVDFNPADWPVRR